MKYSEEEKTEMIEAALSSCSKLLIGVMDELELKTHMHCKIIDTDSNREFAISIVALK